jgi:hypothetical protein
MLLLAHARERARLGNPAWLWTACLVSLAIIFATYVFGAFEIHGWLGNSVNRTTIFAQVLLYADLAIWMVIALDGVSPMRAASSEKLSPPQSPRPATLVMSARRDRCS